MADVEAGAKRAPPKASGKGRKEPKLASEAELKQVATLQKELSQKEEAPSTAMLGLQDVKEVVEMEDDEVATSIEQAMLATALSILSGQGFQYEFPSRDPSNQSYIAALDRIVLKSATKVRVFANISSVRKAAIMTRVLELIHQVVRKGIHITKRDLFYTDVKLFEKQNESDGVLDDVACMIGCTRTSLNVVASDKGVVIGRITYEEDGDFIDCTKMGVGGKAIPSLVNKIKNVKGDAKFVLLVEKDAAFMRLAEDRFYNQYPCVIITGKGQPDVATRLFLKMIKTSLKIPILGLFDSDPHGLKILSVYMSSSKNMSYDSSSLATSDIKWLGVRPSDLKKYKIPDQCRLPMTEDDILVGERLLKEEFIMKNPEWVKELELMLRTKEKAEIQALSNFGFQYLTEQYLPQKIAAGDWI
eukprot:m.89348 g.89348  ORF g.89348 m.89348 type:complete len:416 (+) comp15222_c0_seq1:51-1298(+)